MKRFITFAILLALAVAAIHAKDEPRKGEVQCRTLAEAYYTIGPDEALVDGKVCKVSKKAALQAQAQELPVEAETPLLSANSETAMQGARPGERAQQAQRTQPFGFKAGMTKEQTIALVGKNSVKEDKGDQLTLTTAPKAHPDFELYVICVSSSTGIAKVAAMSRDIETNVFGESIQDRFKETQAALESKYGTATKTFDFLLSGSIWKEPEDWTMGLLKDERRLVAFWDASEGAAIALEAKAFSREKGYIVVRYEFSNFATWAREHDQKKNEAF